MVAALLGAVQSRSRNRVAGSTAVDVKENTLVVGSVQASTSRAGGGGGTAASDLEVDALGVELGAVGLASAVEGNDLVTENVVAGGDVAGDGDIPLEAVADELVGSPAAAGQTLLGDLEELEVGLGGAGAVSGALGEIVDERTLVRLGPGVPLDGDRLSGGDRDAGLSGSGGLVADDVGLTSSVGATKPRSCC